MLLTGKVAVVTGSGTGLGRAYALALAGAGASVVVNARSATDVASVVDEIRKGGGTAQGCSASVHTMEGARQIVQAAMDHFGRVDILVNNAGIILERPLIEMEEREFDDVVAVGLKGVFNCTRQAAPYMVRQKWGRIINMSSGAARGLARHTGYSAAKGGVLSMTAGWARELEDDGITCNAIRAAALTRASMPMLEKARAAAIQRGEKPPTAEDLGLYEPETAAPVAVFLCTDEARSINGQFIAIDGPRITLWAHTHAAASGVAIDGWTVEKLMKQFNSTFGASLQSYGTRDKNGKRLA